MKKLFLILLLLGSVILASCGDYEDEAPNVEWTTPDSTVTDAAHFGAVLTVKFSTPMETALINIGNVSVVDPVNGAWPGLDPAKFNSDPPVSDFVANTPTITVSADKTMFTFSQTNYLPASTCFDVIISQNVRSANNITMKAPYTSCFCTAGTDPKIGTCP
ncbi:MAG: Ig-like domain-containing protein [Desulfuromonadales bacterium]|nr:Ig-like domain-containing protein [Desulfuromonadales bacterium]